MPVKWSITQEMATVHKTQVFSGGACNILDKDGKLLRNKERDRINDWLTEQKIIFFDPQIHPETHGVEYHYPTHFELEMAARAVAKVNLYEISPRTFCGITSLELASDHFRWHEPMVLYFSDGYPDRDEIPAYGPKGHPLFMPDSIKEAEAAKAAHYKECVKNANNMRKYVMNFAREMDLLTVTFGERTYETDIVISSERMHAADLFRAVVRASSGKRVIVTFTGGSHARDELGNPLFIAPEKPRKVERDAILDQYTDEGNALRRAIAELVEISVFVRVTYTQAATIQAMREVLKLSNLLK